MPGNYVSYDRFNNLQYFLSLLLLTGLYSIYYTNAYSGFKEIIGWNGKQMGIKESIHFKSLLNGEWAKR